MPAKSAATSRGYLVQQQLDYPVEAVTSKEAVLNMGSVMNMKDK
jgi:hypothetical protein